MGGYSNIEAPYGALSILVVMTIWLFVSVNVEVLFIFGKYRIVLFLNFL